MMHRLRSQRDIPATGEAQPRRFGDRERTAPRQARNLCFWAWITPAVFLVLGSIVIALAPVTLTATGGVSEDAITAGKWEVVPRAVPSKVVIKTQGTGIAKLSVPELRWPEVFSAKLIGPGTTFVEHSRHGVFTSPAPGTMVIKGVFGNLGVTLLSESTVRSVTVSRLPAHGGQRAVLRSGDGTLLISPDFSYQRTTPFLWRSIPGHLSEPENANLQGSIGGYRINASGKNELSFKEVAPKALLMFLKGLAVFLAASVLVSFGWGIGRSLHPEPSSSMSQIAIQAVGGLALLALAANSLAYLLPTRLTAWILLAAGVLLIAFRHGSRERFSAARADFMRLTKLICIVWLPAILLFLPMFHWGSWYLGEYNTDLFEYSQLSSLLRDHSLLALRGATEAANSGVLTSGAGFEWRSIDTVLASVVSVVGLTKSLTGFAILSVALFLIFALGVAAVATGGQPSRSRYTLAALLLLNPLFVLLFVVNYQSHYFFLAFVPGLVLAFQEILTDDPAQPGNRDISGMILIAAIIATSLAVYPHFAALALIGLLLAALFVRISVRFLTGLVSRIFLATLVLLNIGMLAFRQVINAGTYEASLNAIAKGVLLAPYSSWQVPSLAFGTTTYGWRWPFIDAEVFMGVAGGTLWNMGRISWVPGALEAGSIALLVGGFLLMCDWRRSLRNMTFVASLTIVLTFGLIATIATLRDSTYTALKVGWTAAALAILIVASANYRKSKTWIVVLILIPLAVLWVRTDLLDRATWFIDRRGAAAQLSHSSVQPEIAEVESILNSNPRSISLVRGPQPLDGSDRDRVIYNQLRALIRESGVPCPGCEGYPYTPAELKTVVNCQASKGLIVRIGVSGRARECGKERVLASYLIEAYR